MCGWVWRPPFSNYSICVSVLFFLYDGLLGATVLYNVAPNSSSRYLGKHLTKIYSQREFCDWLHFSLHWPMTSYMNSWQILQVQPLLYFWVMHSSSELISSTFLQHYPWPCVAIVHSHCLISSFHMCILGFFPFVLLTEQLLKKQMCCRCCVTVFKFTNEQVEWELSFRSVWMLDFHSICLFSCYTLRIACLLCFSLTFLLYDLLMFSVETPNGTVKYNT